MLSCRAALNHFQWAMINTFLSTCLFINSEPGEEAGCASLTLALGKQRTKCCPGFHETLTQNSEHRESVRTSQDSAFGWLGERGGCQVRIHIFIRMLPPQPCVRACAHAWAHVWVHAYVCECVCACTQICSGTRICISRHAFVCLWRSEVDSAVDLKRGFLPELGAYRFVRKTGSSTSGMCLSSPQGWQLQVSLLTWLSMSVFGIQTCAWRANALPWASRKNYFYPAKLTQLYANSKNHQKLRNSLTDTHHYPL